MKDVYKIFISAMCIFLLGFFLAWLLSGCDYLQKKTYTEPGTSERAFELCIKSQIEKSTAGGNVQHCQEIQDNFTTAGKQRNFEKCFQFYITNKEKLRALYPELDCYENVFGPAGGVKVK